MSKALENYRKKQDELKALENEASIELQTSICDKLKGVVDDIELLKTIAPKVNIDELVEWQVLIKLVNPKPTPDKDGEEGGKRVKGAELKETILKVIKASGKGGISHADLVKHPDMVALYKAVGKEVSPQANFLQKLVDAKAIKKNGEKRNAKYVTA